MKNVYIVQSNKQHPSVIDLDSGLEYDAEVYATMRSHREGIERSDVMGALYRKPMFIKGGKAGKLGETLTAHSRGVVTLNLNNPLWCDYADEYEGDPEVTAMISRMLTEVMFAEESDGRYVGWWFANQIINPTEKVKVCLIINGVGGAGKNALCELVERSINRGKALTLASELNSVEDLEERFYKSSFVGRTLVYVSETSTKSRKITNKVKSLATASYFEYEAKGVDPQQIDYYGDIALLSNDEVPLPLDETNRKFALVTARRHMVDGVNVNQELWGQLFDRLDGMPEGEAAVAIKEAFRPFLEGSDGVFHRGREFVSKAKTALEKREGTDPLADMKANALEMVQNWGVFTFDMMRQAYEAAFGRDALYFEMANSKKKAQLMAEWGFKVVVSRGTKVKKPENQVTLREVFGVERIEVITADERWFDQWVAGRTADELRLEVVTEWRSLGLTSEF